MSSGVVVPECGLVSVGLSRASPSSIVLALDDWESGVDPMLVLADGSTWFLGSRTLGTCTVETDADDVGVEGWLNPLPVAFDFKGLKFLNTVLILCVFEAGFIAPSSSRWLALHRWTKLPMMRQNNHLYKCHKSQPVVVRYVSSKRIQNERDAYTNRRPQPSTYSYFPRQFAVVPESSSVQKTRWVGVAYNGILSYSP